MSRYQPFPKALATSNFSTQSASASKDALLRLQTPVSRQNTRSISHDPLSKEVTDSLIRRTLCSHLGNKGHSTPVPIHELLPPLTSSNEVDTQLQAFIAIIIREFVQTWYNKITPDPVFVDEVFKIIAHCTRALEQRLRKVDLESLLFDELPELLEVHVQAYRISHHPVHPPPLERDPRETYHSLWPFAALSPVPNNGVTEAQQQMENEAAYRQLLVQGVLAILLPTEDLECDCLTTLVGQIFSEMILGGGIGGKAAEPWLLWESITKIAEEIKLHLPKSKAQVRVERSNSDLGNLRPLKLTRGNTRSWRIGRSIQKTFWLVLEYAFLAFTAVRFLIKTLISSPSLPSRITMKATGFQDLKDHTEPPDLTKSETISNGRGAPAKQPIMKMKVWSCAASLLDIDVRMPWLSGTISMLQWVAVSGPGELGNTDGMVDKILSHAIQTHVLDPKLLPSLLRTARAALFPNNTPAPPRIIPSAAEQLLIRQRCAETILSLIPAKIQDIYFGASIERRVMEVEEVLNIFDDSYCNKHLLYGVVELIVVRLLPEMAEKGVAELLEDRLS